MRRVRVLTDYDRMGGEIYYRSHKYDHDPELLEAYECGVKDGWRAAMEESYGERGNRGGRGGYGERHMIDDRGRVIRYRDDERDWEDEDEYKERRRRSRRTGRYE